MVAVGVGRVAAAEEEGDRARRELGRVQLACGAGDSAAALGGGGDRAAPSMEHGFAGNFKCLCGGDADWGGARHFASTICITVVSCC